MGGKELRIGNNPFVVSIPNGNHPILLDMAMSQFSFGKIDNYAKNNQALPVDGGWDELGQLSNDPKAILKTEQSLPIGYWKGSALSIVLDMLATVLSAGESSCHLGRKPEETGVSQVFICINNDMLSANAIHERMLAEIIDFTHSATPLQDGIPTYYPGEQSFKKRAENIKSGIPVNTDIWSTILLL